MFAKISKKVVAVALVATMAVTTAAVASDDTASAAMKKKASVMQGKEVKLTASGSATWSSSNDNIAHCQKTKGKSIKVLGIKKGTATITATVGILSRIVSDAIRENSDSLTSDIADTVSVQVNKELDYLFREKEESDEKRFRELDETIRSYQKARQEIAATQITANKAKKRHVFGKK